MRTLRILIGVLAILLAGSATGALVTGAFGKQRRYTVRVVTPTSTSVTTVTTTTQPDPTTAQPTSTSPPTSTRPTPTTTTTTTKPPTYPHQCPRNNPAYKGGHKQGPKYKPSRRGWTGGL